MYEKINSWNSYQQARAFSSVVERVNIIEGKTCCKNIEPDIDKLNDHQTPSALWVY